MILGQRFWSKVEIQTLEGCWEWQGSRRRGYGQFRVGSIKKGAHVLSYVALRGEIPAGLELHHLCENPACVNPDHLQPMTHRENLLLSENPVARCGLITHCPQGHEYDEANTYHQRGKRYCRACNRERMRQRYVRRKVTAALVAAVEGKQDEEVAA